MDDPNARMAGLLFEYHISILTNLSLRSLHSCIRVTVYIQGEQPILLQVTLYKAG